MEDKCPICDGEEHQPAHSCENCGDYVCQECFTFGEDICYNCEELT